jgi:5-(carboxyamino)imidazole ribonucleotide mutase
MAWVAILMGSESDWHIMENSVDVLKALELDYEVRILSAHRTPEATAAYVEEAGERGCGVFICGAGLAAHLAGAVAAHTLSPVIGVPLDAGGLGGMDAMLATVQMPGGIPVATVAIGKAGAKNAAFLAAQMLAISDKNLRERLIAERETNAQKVGAQNDELQKHI